MSGIELQALPASEIEPHTPSAADPKTQETAGVDSPALAGTEGDYESMSQEMLVRILRRSETDRKIGFVWERNAIDHEEALAATFPNPVLVPEFGVGEAPWRNLIIEGDNFDSLKLLAMTMRGQAKCIYIDPPYNTGNKDFVYLDRYIGKHDKWRHSTWVEFIHRRLEIAKNLLADDGVIFVSIDDNEFAHLKLILDRSFPGMFVGTFVWRRRGNNNANPDFFFSSDHEYVLCYAAPKFRFGGNEKRWAGYSNPDDDPRGDWTSGDLTLGFNRRNRKNLYYPIHDPDTDTWYPCDPNKVWRFARREEQPADGKRKQRIRTKPMEQMIEEGRILFPDDPETVTYATLAEAVDAVLAGTAPAPLCRLRDAIVGRGGKMDAEKAKLELGEWTGRKIGYGTPRLKRFKKELRNATQPLSSWVRPVKDKMDRGGDERHVIASGYSEEGTKALRELFGETPFSYPKPLSLITELVRQSTNPGDLVVDFFAGSGTTAHAVMLCNDEDEGGRRFVMVSHSEEARNGGRNLAKDVLRERVARAAAAVGIEAGTAYLRMETTPSEDVIYDLEDTAAWVWACLVEGMPISSLDIGDPCPIVEKEERAVAFCRSPNEVAMQKLAAVPAAKSLTIWCRAPARLDGALPREAKVEGLYDRLMAAFSELSR